MKRTILLVVAGIGLLGGASAQKSSTSTDYLVIEGKVKESVYVRIKDLEAMETLHADSVEIVDHNLVKTDIVYQVQGVLLKEVLEKAVIAEEDPKRLSEYYIVCEGADDRKAVFSWDELFNNELGEFVLVVTGKDTKPLAEDPDRIAVISPSDGATARRYIKGVRRIVIDRVKLP